MFGVEFHLKAALFEIWLWQQFKLHIIRGDKLAPIIGNHFEGRFRLGRRSSAPRGQQHTRIEKGSQWNRPLRSISSLAIPSLSNTGPRSSWPFFNSAASRRPRCVFGFHSSESRRAIFSSNAEITNRLRPFPAGGIRRR